MYSLSYSLMLSVIHHSNIIIMVLKFNIVIFPAHLLTPSLSIHKKYASIKCSVIANHVLGTK